MEQQLDRPIASSARLPHGISVGRSRSARLVKPFRGMRIERDVDSTTARLHAFAVHRRTDFAFSHSTAAAIYGLPLPSWSSESIHVTVPAGCRPPVVRGFVGHKLAHWNTVEVEGLPVTTPEQTWLDLATMLRHDDLVVVGDHLVGGPHALTDRERLRRAISESAGRRGTGHARLALESVRTGSESPGETRLRLMLVHAGLPEPSLNYRILDTRGASVARADLVYPVAKLALEYEGDVHRVDRDVWRKDIARRERVEDLGWRMVRVTADDLHHPAALVDRIRRLLRTR
ncbi:MAG: hypothetical protein ACTHJI_12725 [Leifsonia sp.]